MSDTKVCPLCGAPMHLLIQYERDRVRDVFECEGPLPHHYSRYACLDAAPEPQTSCGAWSPCLEHQSRPPARLV